MIGATDSTAALSLRHQRQHFSRCARNPGSCVAAALSVSAWARARALFAAQHRCAASASRAATRFALCSQPGVMRRSSLINQCLGKSACVIRGRRRAQRPHGPKVREGARRTWAQQTPNAPIVWTSQTRKSKRLAGMKLVEPLHPHDNMSISGLVVEYIVAIDVTRVRFPADALSVFYPPSLPLPLSRSLSHSLARALRNSLPVRGRLPEP